MLDVRWSAHTRIDVRRIAEFWLERSPAHAASVMAAILGRVNWIADGRHQSGTPVPDLPKHYRWYLEKIFGYKIYYRIEGDPPDRVSVIAVHHGKQRPLSPAALRKYAH